MGSPLSKLATVFLTAKTLQWILSQGKRITEATQNAAHVPQTESSPKDGVRLVSEESKRQEQPVVESPLEELQREAQQPEQQLDQEEQESDQEQGQMEPNQEQPEQQESKQWTLQVCDLRELIEAKQREYFEGSREWLFDEVRDWVQSEERLFWLVGGSGTGKSVVSAQLLVTDGIREHIKAWHFCRHDNSAESDPRVILQSWAAMLTTELPGFEVADVGKAMSASSLREMFELLIAEPLKNIQNNGTGSPPSCVIFVLDAVDELSRKGADDVSELFTEFDKLPEFAKLFVASRDGAELGGRLKDFEQVKLDLVDFRNQVDLRMYLTEVARRHVTLELNTKNLETKLERDLGLAPARLQNQLRGLDEVMQQCKDIYAATVAKIQNDDCYTDICNICELTPEQGLRQDSSDLDQLFLDAAEAHGKFKSLLLNDLDERHLIDPGLKSRGPALRKITDGDASRVKDLVRFAALFPSCSEMKQFVERLRETEEDVWPGVTLLALKNMYSSPSTLGHREMNLTLGVELTDGRVHLCELRVNLEEMWEANKRVNQLLDAQVTASIPAACERAEVKDVKEFTATLSKLLRSPVLTTAVRELEFKAGGLFLRANLLARHLETMDRKADFRELEELPNELPEMYEASLARIVQSKEQWEKYLQLITLIIAAREPLPVTLARELVGEGCEEMEQALSALFPVRKSRFQVMHKSVAEWLQGERQSPYVINQEDIRTAHQRMGRQFHAHLQSNQPAHEENPFCVRHVVYHLCLAGLWDQVYEVASDINWLLARAQMDPVGVVFDLEFAANFAASPHQHTIRLMGKALRMDLEELRHDYRSMPSRLVGRLIGHESKEVQTLLSELRKWPGPPQGWWCPVQPTLLPASGALLTSFHFLDPIECVRWSSGNEQIAIACSNCVLIYEASTGQCLQTLGGHTSTVTALSWHAESRICSGSADKTVRVWDAASGQCLHTLQGHTDVVTSVSWSGDGRICSGSKDKTVRVWDASHARCTQTLQGHSGWVQSVSWSSDDRICSGSADKTIRVWDTLSGKCIQTFNGHDSWVQSVSWSSDGRICSGSDDNTVRVWDVSSGQCVQTLQGHSSRVTSVSWSEDGKICSGSYDNTVRVWDEEKCIQTLQGHSTKVTSVSWSKDRRICSGSYDKTVRVWEVSQGKSVQILPGASDLVTSVSWSEDGRLCSGSLDKSVRIWDVASGQCTQVILGHSAPVSSVAWSSDGRVCSGSNDNTARVWEVATGRCLQTLDGHSHWVTSVAWSHDGRICSGSYDNAVRVWEAASGQCLQTLEGHTFYVTSVAWSRDGQRICSGSMDRTVRVWNVTTGQCVQTLKGQYVFQITSVAWTADDKILSSEGHTVRVWDLASAECLQTVPQSANDFFPTIASLRKQPVGFAVGSRISLSPTNPLLGVAVEDNVVHSLRRLGGRALR